MAQCKRSLNKNVNKNLRRLQFALFLFLYLFWNKTKKYFTSLPSSIIVPNEI